MNNQDEPGHRIGDDQEKISVLDAWHEENTNADGKPVSTTAQSFARFFRGSIAIRLINGGAGPTHADHFTADLEHSTARRHG